MYRPLKVGVAPKTRSLLLATGLVFLIAGFVLVGLFFLVLIPQQSAPRPNPPSACFENGVCLQVELARSDEERARGLMFRSSLPENAGVLFVFDTMEEHAFWMKNTLIPLDIVWLGSDGRVVGFREGLPPCEIPVCPVYSVGVPSRWVLEANAGFVAENGIRKGQRVLLQNLPS